MTIMLQLMRFALDHLGNADAAVPPTAREEADHVRAMAEDLLGSDPYFAQELYAVAYRHELAALESQGA